MTSVRDSLNVVGQSVSIKQLAHQRNESFPLSLRKFVGAPPPGRILKKVISLDFLQRKFDVFFNQRIRPLFQIRLDGPKFGASTLTVAFDDPVTSYDHDKPLSSQDLAGPGEVLSYPGLIFGVHRYHFSDVKSDKITLNILPGPPLSIEILIHFETEGVEIRVEDRPDIDFDGFNIKLNMVFGTHNDLVDVVNFVDLIDSTMKTMTVKLIASGNVLLKWNFKGKAYQQVVNSSLVNLTIENIRLGLIKEFVNTDVSVNVNWEPDGYVADNIESTFNKKIIEGLSADINRDKLNKVVTRWLVGGDYHVLGVASEDQVLSIDYIIPPGQIEPFPDNPQPPLEPGLLSNIDHIVVLMMENRSFDHMLGYLRKDGDKDGKKRLDIDGLGDINKNPYKGRDYPSFLLPDTEFNESPPHDYEPVENQIDGGKLDGFVAAFAKKYESQGVDPGRVMGYHNAAHVPVYDALAREFLICQRWFAAHPGPTFCNRFYTLTGRLNRDSFGNFQLDNFQGNDFKPVSTKTIFDHLNDHGVSWHFYEQRYCSLRMYERYTTDDTYIVDADDPVKGFFASAKAGTLPSVSFIDPNFIDEPDGQDNDDQAPANIAAGQNLIGRVVDAVVHSPKWNKTLLIITYDEHGGFYDHVNPLDPHFRGTAKPVSGIDHYGVRVPAFIISPWVDQGAVSDVVFDHTSIAKTIARRFMSANPPDMGERMAAANDLSMVLRSTPRQDTPNIPVPPPPPPKSTLAMRAAPVAESNVFKEVMRFIRSRYPVRR